MTMVVMKRVVFVNRSGNGSWVVEGWATECLSKNGGQVAKHCVVPNVHLTTIYSLPLPYVLSPTLLLSSSLHSLLCVPPTTILLVIYKCFANVHFWSSHVLINKCSPNCFCWLWTHWWSTSTIYLGHAVCLSIIWKMFCFGITIL